MIETKKTSTIVNNMSGSRPISETSTQKNFEGVVSIANITDITEPTDDLAVK